MNTTYSNPHLSQYSAPVTTKEVQRQAELSHRCPAQIRYAKYLVPAGTTQPIIDWMTIVCCVVDDKTGRHVQGSEFYRRRFGQICIECNDDTGEVISEKGNKIIKHPFNGASFKVWSNKNRLMLSGNPTHWLQGHAMFCSYQPQFIAEFAFQRWVRALNVPGFKIVPDHFSTLHITHMYDCLTRERALEHLEWMKYSVVKGRAQRSQEDFGFYFGKSSKLKATKIYVDPRKLINGRQIPDFAGRFIRCEQVYHTESIRKMLGFSDARQLVTFHNCDLQAVYESDMAKLKYLVAQSQTERIQQGITAKQVGLIYAWKNHCLSDFKKTRKALNDQRAAILDKCKIDIFAPPSPVNIARWAESSPELGGWNIPCVTNKSFRALFQKHMAE